MKKVIILSIQPQWLEKVLNGKKTIEIRKSMPKCDYPIDVYLYCTKPNRFPNTSNGNKVQILTFDETTNKYRLWSSSYGKVLNGKIVAKFTLNKVESFDGFDIIMLEDLRHMFYGSCLTTKQIKDYSDGKDLYGWHIDNLEIFDKPMELREFYRKRDCCGIATPDCFKCSHYYQSYSQDLGYEDHCTCSDYLRLTRPFQSWGYAYKEE